MCDVDIEWSRCAWGVGDGRSDAMIADESFSDRFV